MSPTSLDHWMHRITVPTLLLWGEKDRVLPHPRFTRHFTKHLAESTKITHLGGVGHIPMFEAPDRVTKEIIGFVDAHVDPKRATG